MGYDGRRSTGHIIRPDRTYSSNVNPLDMQDSIQLGSPPATTISDSSIIRSSCERFTPEFISKNVDMSSPVATPPDIPPPLLGSTQEQQILVTPEVMRITSTANGEEFFPALGDWEEFVHRIVATAPPDMKKILQEQLVVSEGTYANVSRRGSRG